MTIHPRVRVFLALSTNYPSKYLQITGDWGLQLTVEWLCHFCDNNFGIALNTFWLYYNFIGWAISVEIPFKDELLKDATGHHQHAPPTSSSSGFTVPQVEVLLNSCSSAAWSPGPQLCRESNSNLSCATGCTCEDFHIILMRLKGLLDWFWNFKMEK